MTVHAKAPSCDTGKPASATKPSGSWQFLAIAVFNTLVSLLLALSVYVGFQTEGYDWSSDPSFWLMLANAVLAPVNGRNYLVLRRRASAR
jgi:hypothetical protein